MCIRDRYGADPTQVQTQAKLNPTGHASASGTENKPAEEAKFNLVKDQDLSYLRSEKHKTWEDLRMPPEFIDHLVKLGYRQPSRVQAIVINTAISDMRRELKGPHNIVAQAKNGSGKTLAFLIPSVLWVDESIEHMTASNMMCPQVLIIAPFRELVQQIYEEARKLVYKTRNLSIGKLRQQDNMSGHIMIATIQAVDAQLKRKKFSFANLKVLVLDEADVFLMDSNSQSLPNATQRNAPGQPQGEREGLLKMLRSFYDKRITGKEFFRTYLLSATFPDDKSPDYDFIRQLKGIVVKSLIKDKETLKLDGVKQLYTVIPKKNKFEFMLGCLAKLGSVQIIIFVATKLYGLAVKQFLEGNNFSVALVTSDVDKIERDSIIKKFKYGDIKILVSTNLLARGADYRDVGLVINLDLPTRLGSRDVADLETYLHRVGRTGRFGDYGVALNVCDNNMDIMQQIIDYYKMEITPMTSVDDLEKILEETRKKTIEKRELQGEKVYDKDLQLTICMVNCLSFPKL
eukprot:TRINITY_DN8202_c0_g2_i2.p1 TRINITY_DN8202_c0_g2~~TRINITY_DN8202_c0_g2_i2.p1  ORF type:complete len:531 (+),score=96.48 TRINITY_DN8202_c0_g2_i2:47-1594(+)